MPWAAICITDYNGITIEKYYADTFQEARKKLIEHTFDGYFWYHLYEDRDNYDQNHPRIQKYSTVEPNFYQIMMDIKSEHEYDQFFRPFFTERASHLAIDDLQNNEGKINFQFE